MREIKFRGKHLEPGGTWKYGSLVVCENGDCLIGTCKEYGSEARYMRNEVYPDSVGQYTGLKDRNGKEIYEGDIIQIPDDYEMYGMACGEKYEVDFKNGRFRLRPKYRPDALGYDLEGVEECEVLGNKYENPELLEVIE